MITGVADCIETLFYNTTDCSENVKWHGIVCFHGYSNQTTAKIFKLTFIWTIDEE